MSAKYALVIGNSQYDDPRLAQLTAPGRDANDLARILGDKDSCAFDAVQVLLNQPEPAVRTAIDEFFDGKMPDDLLLLYFSGHGVRDELGVLYLAVRDTNRSRLRSSAIKSDFIQEVMEQSRAKRQVLILDCCNSGAFQQGTKAATGGSIGIANAFGGYGRVILTASDSLQYAWQGDAVIGNTENSLFTHFLVEGLKGEAEVDGDGYITVDALYDYAYEQVKLATPNQTPSKFSSKQEGEIVLRQITRIDQIKPVPLPPPLIESIENPLALVRLGAVEELSALLKGRNLGLARSAREALESLCLQDDSLRVRKAASDALAPIVAAEQQAASVQGVPVPAAHTPVEAVLAAQQEGERKHLADLQAQEKAERERLKREQSEAQRLAAAKAKEERGARRTAEQAASAAQGRTAPRWLSILWIVLGIVISSALTFSTPWSVTTNLALYGAFAGLTVAVVLYLQHSLRRWTSILWITLGWALAWTITGFTVQYLLDNSWSYGFSYRFTVSELFSGGVAGAVMALVLYFEGALSRRDELFGIVVAWGFGALINALVILLTFAVIFDPAGMSITGPLVIGGAMDAVIGGFVTVWLLRHALLTTVSA